MPSEKQMSRHNVAWALADIEHATGGEHSEEEVEMINRHFKSKIQTS